MKKEVQLSGTGSGKDSKIRKYCSRKVSECASLDISESPCRI